MNEHRRQILDMLASGKITADEAERLLSALESTPEHAAGDAKPSPRYLHVVVDKTVAAMRGAKRSIFGCRCSCCAPACASPTCCRATRANG